MVIIFVALGVFLGASAAVFTLVSGGSILLAIAAYSGVGAIGALAAIFALVFFRASKLEQVDWRDKQENRGISV